MTGRGSQVDGGEPGLGRCSGHDRGTSSDARASEQHAIDVYVRGPGEAIDNGIRVSGSALYDGELGYPVWIELDLEVVGPNGSSIEPPLPDRMVFTVSGLVATSAPQRP